ENVLGGPDAQHRRDCPKLAHAKLGHRLVLAHEQRDVVDIEVTFCVRDQLDGNFIGAWITSERSRRELWQLLVVALGKARPDLANVLLNAVEVVEQPVHGRPSVEPSLRSAGQCTWN